MQHLLFLAHRIPYPPNKGDKIRSYHLLQHLAARYRLHLGAFIDDAADWQYVETVKAYCASTHFVRLDSLRARLRSLPALATTRPLSLDYYRHAGMQRWVAQTLAAAPISRTLVFSSVMAQYAQDPRLTRRVIDFVDVDSDKWLQYAQKKRWPMRWLYRREGRRLLDYERQVAAGSDVSLFVSEAEAALFRRLAPESAGRIGHLNNGVDLDYFSPAHTFENPYGAQSQVLVFTGAMDYWPNIDAVQWFAQAIFPEILARQPQARFVIVGARPAAQVQALAQLPGVSVTGTVPDIRPYLAHARCAVAPLRIARGIQNKVLEAMSMGIPVLATPQAFEGISATPGRDLLVADGASALAEAALTLLQEPRDPALALGAEGRRLIERQYAWRQQLAVLDTLMEADAASSLTTES